MPTDAKQLFDSLPTPRRHAIEKRAAQMRGGYMALQEPGTP